MGNRFSIFYLLILVLLVMNNNCSIGSKLGANSYESAGIYQPMGNPSPDRAPRTLSQSQPNQRTNTSNSSTPTVPPPINRYPTNRRTITNNSPTFTGPALLNRHQLDRIFLDSQGINYIGRDVLHQGIAVLDLESPKVRDKTPKEIREGAWKSATERRKISSKNDSPVIEPLKDKGHDISEDDSDADIYVDSDVFEVD